MVLAAMVLTPAMLAGTIAGEKIRGTLAMLLVTRLSPREILLGRASARASLLVGFLVAGWPPMVLFVAAGHLPIDLLLATMVLPLAVAFGTGGLTLALSALSRRGRDALMAVYLLEIVALIAGPLAQDLIASAGVAAWLAWNPLTVLSAMSTPGAGPIWICTGCWCLAGLSGLMIGTAALWPSYHRSAADRPGRSRQRKWRRAPPIGDRPVLWKERHFEHDSRSGFGARWLHRLALVALIGWCVALFVAAWGARWQPAYRSDWAAWRAAIGMAGAATLPWLTWLVHWAVGFRAASTIATERERATWVPLLVTPLDGRDILPAKLLGSLYSLRWLFAALIVAGSLALAVGDLSIGAYGVALGLLIVGGVYMAAVGIWQSLRARTLAGALTGTLLGWLLGMIGTAVVSWALVAFVFASLCLLGLSLWLNGWRNLPDPNDVWTVLAVVQPVIRLGLLAAAAVSIFGGVTRRFDQLADRIPPQPPVPIIDPGAANACGANGDSRDLAQSGPSCSPIHEHYQRPHG
jgi:ABC-type Na+ efflux pump permease subunit